MTQTIDRAAQRGSMVRARLSERLATMRWAAGALIRSVRNNTDRHLHDARRRRAIQRVSTLTPRSVLMVCYGNICRSPYAAFALSRALQGTKTVVDSAGFFGPDRPSPERAKAAAARLGIDLRPHRSKVLTAEMLREHDLVVVMESDQHQRLAVDWGISSRQVLVLGDLDPFPIQTRAIGDPYAGSSHEFTECYVRVQRCVDALAAILMRGPQLNVSPSRVRGAGRTDLAGLAI